MKPQHVNENLLRIVGMSRSGNHAVINWLLAQAQGRWCFLNCAEPRTNPFVTARPTDDGACHQANCPNVDFEAERQGRLSRKDWLLYSHEDSFLGPAFGGAADRAQAANLGQSRRRFDVLILRDPYNLFASRRRWGRGLISERTAVRMWKQHAREFLGERRHLQARRVLISYNAWVANQTYRRRIAEKLGLTFTDVGLHEVANCGGGSSFDGHRFAGQADRMDVLNRWRRYADDPDFRNLFDARVVSMSRRIFGSVPEDGAMRVGSVAA